MIAQAAQELGASHLGFILYETSPRFIYLSSAYEIIDSLEQPRHSMVLVDVAPVPRNCPPAIIPRLISFKFIFPWTPIRLRFGNGLKSLGGKSYGWLLKSLQREFPETLLPLANGFLIDAYSEAEFGGTGKSDWAEFIRLKTSFPEKDWILAGGLGPENLMKAVKQAQPDALDCNSGVEDRPGEEFA